jgi:2-phospho-L-lactate guanylyltransferase
VKATAVIPIKRLGAAKQRLGDRLTEPERAGLAMASFADSLDAICHCEAIERVIVVTGDAKAERHALWRARRTDVPIEVVQDPADRGHNEAAAIGAERARALGAQAVAMLPGDCPLLDPGELAAAIDDLEPSSVLVVPDRHGTGTNALILSPPNAIGPSFGPGSCERHLELTRKHGMLGRRTELGSLALDIDTPDDLAAVAAALAGSPGSAPRTVEALQRMGIEAE